MMREIKWKRRGEPRHKLTQIRAASIAGFDCPRDPKRRQDPNLVKLLALFLFCSALSPYPTAKCLVQDQIRDGSRASHGDKDATQKRSHESASSSSSVKVNDVDRKVVYQGIAVALNATSLASREDSAHDLHAGDDVTFQFKISDTQTGSPLTGTFPRGWIDIERPNEKVDCAGKVKAFISGGLLARPMLDLNVYYVLALNEDASISVIDPHFGYGGSKLLAMVSLTSPGEDWVLSPDGATLFVSMPDVNLIAAVSTATWKVVAHIDVGARPSRLVLQPDRGRLWAGYQNTGSGGQDSGVAVINTEKFAVEARISTGKGRHQIALDDDGRYVFVTNADDDNVSIIDARTLAKVKDIRAGGKPSSIAFSNKGRLAYVVHEQDGHVAAVDAARQKIIATVPTGTGEGQTIQFAPDGRFAFIANPGRNTVYVLDAASNKIVQTADIDGGPDQISFSDTLAYIRRRSSEIVMMMPLPRGDVQGQSVTLTEFPGGQHHFGKVTKPSLASSIVRAPGENAALVGNAADKSIYYYQEGMAAPMGSFSNYGHEPRAVLVVDRSLRERLPGVYETTARLASEGKFTVAFVLDTPRIVHCFPLQVKAPLRAEARALSKVKIEALLKDQIMRVGERFRVRFKLSDPATSQLKSNLVDVSALVFLAPGVWQARPAAREIERGTYEIEFAPPESGFYYVYLQSPALGLTLDNPQYLILQAVDAQRR
jgi:YVTN family beta-propeller protein